MKKIILSLVFIAFPLFSTLTNAETLTNATGAANSCTPSAAQVTFVYAGTHNGAGALQILTGGKSCWVAGLSDTRLAMAAAMLTEAVSSGRNALVSVTNGNISVQLY